jgi:glycosyltransferase involved in cell wall biosynthesis
MIMPGWREDLADWLYAMDVFLLTSHNEGMGRVLVEAMACGRPIVATEVGGVPSVVENGASGFLVPSRTPEAMAQAVLKLLADPELRNAFGEKGRKKAEEFSLCSMVDKIDKLYREWIERKALYY